MTITESIGSLLQFSLLLVVAVCCFYGITAKISPTPTLPWVRRKMMGLLGASTMTHDGVYKIAELGAGWGGMTKALAVAYPNSTITGYESSLAPYWLSKVRGLFYGQRVTMKQLDFFKEDLSDYDVLVCYLSPYHMKELGPQFATLKPGSLILSNAFPILDRVPIDTAETNIGVKIPVFLYRI